MTRDRAIELIRAAFKQNGYNFRGMGAEANVDAMVALGLLKLDDPKVTAIGVLSDMVIHPNRFSAPDTGWMIGPHGAEMIMERLAGAGLKVVPT